MRMVRVVISGPQKSLYYIVTHQMKPGRRTASAVHPLGDFPVQRKSEASDALTASGRAPVLAV